MHYSIDEGLFIRRLEENDKKQEVQAEPTEQNICPADSTHDPGMNEKDGHGQIVGLHVFFYKLDQRFLLS